ncbi:MAG: hypothetical protein ACE5E5_09045 [Phycisphaerae bacterium]
MISANQRIPNRLGHVLSLIFCGCLLAGTFGCRASGSAGVFRAGSSARKVGDKKPRPVVAVHCIYGARPWLNLDRSGDRDPEGIRYRVFLDLGTNDAVIRDGMFHIEMYRIDRAGKGELERTLVSDWHYPTSRMPQIAKPGMLGPGYFLHLRWASKDIAGKEIEISTVFEDEFGRSARSETKRFRVPKYPV